MVTDFTDDFLKREIESSTGLRNIWAERSDLDSAFRPRWVRGRFLPDRAPSGPTSDPDDPGLLHLDRDLRDRVFEDEEREQCPQALDLGNFELEVSLTCPD